MKEITIYTDGACSGNPGRGGCAGIIIDGSTGQVMHTIEKGYRRTTNNRMEIMAVVESLEELRKHITFDSRDTDIKVTVCSDSQLVVNTMNKDWAKKANTDLWLQLEKAVAMFPAGSVSFVKVKGHLDNKWNIEADKHAVRASRQPAQKLLTDRYYETISPFSMEKSGPEDEITLRISCNEKRLPQVLRELANIYERRGKAVDSETSYYMAEIN